MLVDLNVKGHFRHDEDGTSSARRHLNGAAKVNTKFHSLKFFDLFRLLLCPIEIVSLLALSTMSHNRNQSPKTPDARAYCRHGVANRLHPRRSLHHLFENPWAKSIRKLRSRKLTPHFMCGACFNDVNLSTRPVAARPLAIENTQRPPWSIMPSTTSPIPSEVPFRLEYGFLDSTACFCLQLLKTAFQFSQRASQRYNVLKVASTPWRIWPVVEVLRSGQSSDFAFQRTNQLHLGAEKSSDVHDWNQTAQSRIFAAVKRPFWHGAARDIVLC